MCLQSPNYDIIEHMLSVYKWTLKVILGGTLETADHKVSVGEFTEGQYLELCEKLKFTHKITAKVIEDYTYLMDSTNYEIRLKFTKDCKTTRKNIVDINFADGGNLRTIYMNKMKDEFYFQQLVQF